MANIPISSLPEVTTVTDNHYLAVDNGTTSSKIKIGKFNESATASAKAYAEAAAASADAAEGYKNAAQTAKSETQNLITSAQTIVSNAQTYAGNAQTSENNASTYASNASNSASAAANSATQASQYAQGVDAYATEAKSWAQGGTGTRSGEDTDNSKYYSNLAHSHEQDASSAASAAAGSASDASGYKDAASGSATSASNSALVAEGYANGKQNGEAVSSGTYYHNNAAYFANQASGSATAASNQADRAEAAVVHEPYIGENGNWYVWSWEDNDYVDTEVDATGPAGADGQDGDPGPAGNGIVSITKTSTSGLVDTYTILYTNGDTDTFTVTNGQDGTGSGDMTKAVYDSTNAVADEGGIVAYVAAQLSGFSTELSGLSDVDLTSLAAGQTLTYNATTQKWVNTSLGTAAALDVPASGDASTTEVVKGDDSRLTDARTPVSHTHTLSNITDAGSAAAKDSTNAVTQNSTDLVESGAVYTGLDAKQNKILSSPIGGQTQVEGALSSQNIAIANEVETRAKLGAHNLLPINKTTETPSSTNTTFTVNSDGTIDVSTTSAGSTGVYWYLLGAASTELPVSGKNLVMTGCPTDGGASKYRLVARCMPSGNYIFDTGNGVNIPAGTTSLKEISINVAANTVLTTPLTFKPMIRLATDSYTEYTPYVPTNAELLSANTNAVLGAHNLLPSSFNGTTSGSGVTFADNKDGTITANGTASGNNSFYIAMASDNYKKIPAGTYKFYKGTSNPNVYFFVGAYNGTTWVKSIVDTANDVAIGTIDYNGYDRLSLGIRIPDGTVISSAITIKPMICDSSDPSTAYAPYAMTNRELTNDAVLHNLRLTTSESTDKTILESLITQLNTLLTENLQEASGFITASGYDTFAFSGARYSASLCRAFAWKPGYLYTVNLYNDTIVVYKFNGTVLS